MKPRTVEGKIDYLFERAWREDLRKVGYAVKIAASPELGGELAIKAAQASRESSPSSSSGRSSSPPGDQLLLSVVRELQNMGPRFCDSLVDHLISARQS